MSITKDLEIKISNGEARLSEEVYVYQKDRGVELRLKLNLIRINYRSAVRSSLFEVSTLFAGATILKPNGEIIGREKVEIVDNIISFTIDEEFTDQVDEIGIYKIQFHLYDLEDNRISIPPIQFEVKELLANIDEDGSSKFGRVDFSNTDTCLVTDDGKEMEIFIDGKYIKTVWNGGDFITSVKLNKIEEAIEYLSEEVVVLKNEFGTLDNGVENLNHKLSNVLTNDNHLNIEMIPYSTANDINITSVKDALDKLLYVDLVISFNSNIATTLEKGMVVDTILFNWSYNKKIVSQIFNNETLNVDVRTYAYSTPLSSNKTFTLIANDGTKGFSRNISFSFLNGRYWGVSNSTSYDSGFINGLSKELSSSRNKTFTVNCGADQHIYYCIPTSFGTPTFTVGGFSGGFNKVSTIQFVNIYGHTESYDIYKSTNNNLGNTTVVVS